VEICVTLPEDLHAALSLELFSPLKNRVPYGAVSTTISTLIREWLKNRGIETEGTTTDGV
jgi:hypothetical protein